MRLEIGGGGYCIFGGIMKISYICSPYRSETERQKQKHIEYARELLKQNLYYDLLPIAPHLLYPQILNDNNHNERLIALDLCFKWIEKSDVIYAGCRYGISEGMKQEIALAEKLGKEIIYLEE